jgi:hypothetical protein
VARRNPRDDAHDRAKERQARIARLTLNDPNLHTPASGHIADAVAASVNPHATFWRTRSGASDRGLFAGMTPRTFRMCAPDTNLLVLAPARSVAGKTTSVVIPNVLIYKGPVVSTSTKPDVLRQTALVRSGLGNCWHFTPTNEPTAPGCINLRWSLPYAVWTAPEDDRWDLANELAEIAIAAARKPGAPLNDSGQHFDGLAARLLSTLLYVAAHAGRDLEWVLRVLSIADSNADLPDQGDSYSDDPEERDRARLTEWPQSFADVNAYLADEVQELGPWDSFQTFLNTEARERSGAISTTALALSAYQSTSARKSTRNPNFDVTAFVRGNRYMPNVSLDVSPDEASTWTLSAPAEGEYDTVYITGEDQTTVAPIIVAFLAHVRWAAARENRSDPYGDDESPMRPVLLALDEMGTMAALPDLPTMLAKGGTGAIVLGVLQDLSQARERWGAQGMGLVTLFQNVLVFPGLRDKDTLELFSMLAGEGVRQQSSYSSSLTQNYGSNNTGHSRQESESLSTERFNLLPPSVIYQGRPESPFGVLFFSHDKPQPEWLYATPCYSATPWPQLLIKAGAFVAKYAPHSRRTAVPLFMLHKDGKVSPNIATVYAEAYERLRGLWPTIRRSQGELP